MSWRPFVWFRKKLGRQALRSNAPAANHEDVKNPQRTEAGRPVRFDPSLIANLTADHQRLLKLFGEVLRLAESGAWPQVPPVLQQFRVTLTDHLLTEGAKLYAFMGIQLRDDSDTYQVFQGYKREMGKIGKVVLSFVDEYLDARALATPEQKQRFVSTAKSISAALADRIQREEAQLYPLYTGLG